MTGGTESFRIKICFHGSNFPQQVSVFLAAALYHVSALCATLKLRDLWRRGGSEAEQAAAAQIR